jgi:hypothetical protein
MSSELAESICTTYFNNTEGALLRDVIDDELQEVREVLDHLRQSQDCWCVATWKGMHDGRCQRTRALMARLRVDGGKENDGPTT